MSSTLRPDAESQRKLDELGSRSLVYRASRELKELAQFSRRFPHLAPYNAWKRF